MDGYRVIVDKSTVPIGTARKVQGGARCGNRQMPQTRRASPARKRCAFAAHVVAPWERSDHEAPLK